MQQPNLFELALAYSTALDELADTEVPLIMQSVADDAKLELSDKVDRWGQFLRRLDLEYKEAEEMTRAFRVKRESLKTKLEKSKEWLKSMMEAAPTVPYKGKTATLKLQNNGGKKALDLLFTLGEKTVTNIVDHFSIDLIPDEYLKPVSFYTLDTEKLRADLDAGKELAFAKLVQGKHVRVTV